jgi:hypothetical protein
MQNSYFSRTPQRTVPDAELILQPKATSIAATTPTAVKKVATAHLEDFMAIIHGNFYTGYVKDTAEWVANFEASMSMAGPFKPIGQTVLRPTSEGINAGITVTSEMVQAIVPGAEYFRVNFVKVGTPSPLLVGAYISPYSC